MNRFVSVCLAATVAAAAFAAGPAAAQQRTDVVLGQQLEPPTLDPRATTAVAVGEIVYDNVMQGLVRMDQDGAILPSLATDWNISDDGLTYTFELRAGVTFHDGSAFDAADVVFSIGALAPPSTQAWASLFSAISSVEAVDADTVRITLSRPDADLLFSLAWPQAVIYAPETSAQAAANPVGTGPYRFVRWQAGSSIELARYDGYWGPAPAIANATFRFISDPAVAYVALLAGDVDGFSNFPTYARVSRLDADPRFTVAIGSTEGETMLITNNARSPFDNPLVRQAMAHAIDRELINDVVLYGLGVPIGSHFSPLHPAYIDLTDTYPYDVAAARRLLAEAGYPNGFSATLTLPPPAYARESGAVLQQLMRDIGITLTIQNVDWAQWLDEVLGARNYDLTIVAHAEPNDIGIYADPNYYYGYQSERFNAVFAEMKATTDEADRIPLFQELQRILAEDAVNGYLFELPKVGVWDARLMGMWENAVMPANILQELSWAQ